MAGKNDINQALKDAEQLMGTPGVEGVGIGKNNGKDCIKVFTSLPEAEAKNKIPPTIKGFEVVIEFTGPIQAFGAIE